MGGYSIKNRTVANTKWEIPTFTIEGCPIELQSKVISDW